MGRSPPSRPSVLSANQMARKFRMASTEQSRSAKCQATSCVMADATVLTIAHRLETVMEGDTVVVVGEGKVVERGPPRELCDAPGS